jgi:hypothetical protein
MKHNPLPEGLIVVADKEVSDFSKEGINGGRD